MLPSQKKVCPLCREITCPRAIKLCTIKRLFLIFCKRHFKTFWIVKIAFLSKFSGPCSSKRNVIAFCLKYCSDQTVHRRPSAHIFTNLTMIWLIWWCFSPEIYWLKLYWSCMERRTSLRHPAIATLPGRSGKPEKDCSNTSVDRYMIRNTKVVSHQMANIFPTNAPFTSIRFWLTGRQVELLSTPWVTECLPNTK